MLSDILLLSMLILVVWYTWDAMRTREIARHAGKQACADAQVQFLDQTVQTRKVWLCRNAQRRLQLCRLYVFEFARGGGERYLGRVVLVGRQVFEVEMDAFRI